MCLFEQPMTVLKRFFLKFIDVCNVVYTSRKSTPSRRTSTAESSFAEFSPRCAFNVFGSVRWAQTEPKTRWRRHWRHACSLPGTEEPDHCGCCASEVRACTLSSLSLTWSAANGVASGLESRGRVDASRRRYKLQITNYNITEQSWVR